MGNCLNSDSCPSHPGNSIQKICLCESCLEPLCKQCVKDHHGIHERLGYPAKIAKYDPVKKEVIREQENKKTKEDEMMQNFTPTSLLIKDMTYEYFASHSDKHAASVLQNLQLWKGISEDPSINRKIQNFLNRQLELNQEVVGKDCSHLY